MENPLVPHKTLTIDQDRHGPIIDALERVLADIPASAAEPADAPDSAARKIARRAAKRAAMLSGSLALPPGPLGFMTLLPDLYLIWQTQRQMVADIFGVYGRSAELTRTHMLYCLFRHAASHVLRDVAVRGGQRMVDPPAERRRAAQRARQHRHDGLAADRGQRRRPLDSARRRGGGRRVRLLGHAAGREHSAAAADERPSTRSSDE